MMRHRIREPETTEINFLHETGAQMLKDTKTNLLEGDLSRIKNRRDV